MKKNILKKMHYNYVLFFKSKPLSASAEKNQCAAKTITSFLSSALLIFSLCISGKLSAQERVLKGKVNDAFNKPIGNVSIIIKENSKFGTTTDASGSFSIRVSATNTLIFETIGYERKEVAVGNDVELSVTMEISAVNLGEVVVGYGTQSKKNLIAGVTQIKGDKIRSTPAANLQNMLVGKVAGLTTQQQSGQPGADGANFYIRGVATEVGTNKPLVLIDDVESDYDQVGKINPNEVESISFLKDAIATSVYGIKGANGVMLITTTRGKIGAPKFNFSTQTGVQVQIKPAELLDSYNTALFWNEAVKNEAKLGNTSFRAFTDDDLQKFKDGSDPYMHPNVDWYDVLFKKGSIIHSDNLSVSGGNEKVKYFTSIGYLFQNGILKDFEATDYYGGPLNVNNNFYYKRYNFRSNLDINASKNLVLKVDLSGNTDERNQPGITNVFNQVYSFKSLPPWVYNVTNPNGSYGFTNSSNGRSPEGYTSLPNNIVGQIALGGYERRFTTQLNGNINAIQKLDMITPGLKLRALLGYTNIERASRTVSRSGQFPSFQFDPVTNTYIPRNPAVFTLPPLFTSTSAVVSNGNFIAPLNRVNLQANLSYERSFGKHNVSGLLLYSSSSETFVTNDINSNRIPIKFSGYTFRVTYNYRRKYLFETAGAYNGSDRFNTRYGFFPSAGLGYNISDEKFWKNTLPFINNFKIRGSVGLVGADDIGGGFRYLYQSIYNFGPGTFFGDNSNPSTGIFEGALGKDNVTWQKERKIDFGVEFGMFRNKLTGSVNVFRNLRYDILYRRNTIPLFYGIGSPPPQNIGRVSNKGIEIDLNYEGRIRKVGFSVGTKYSVARNKLLEFDEAPTLFPWLRRTGNSLGVGKYLIFDGYYSEADQALVNAETAAINAAIAGGQPIPKRTLAIPSGPDPLAGFLKFKDLSGDGIINDNDASYTGNPNLPESNLIFNFGVNYKRFSLTAIVQSAFDYTLSLYRDNADPLYANLTKNDMNFWTPQKGNSATRIIPLIEYTRSYQSAGNNGSLTSTYYNINAYYIRLRNVSLSYDLNTALIKRMGLATATIFVNGSNLLTKSNVYERYNFDPEVATGTQTGVYPVQKIFNFGINVSF